MTADGSSVGNRVRTTPMSPLVTTKEPGPGSWLRSRDAPALLLGAVIAGGVCLPFFAGGRLFLLDWVIGPQARVASDSFFGLDGGLTTGVPLSVAMGALDHLVGAPATWFPVAVFFPLATVSMSKLVGGPLLTRLGAATLYAVNPFVFQRLYAGQIALLLGYSLLPLVLASMVRAVHRQGIGRYSPVLWMALLTAMSPHFAWICGVMLMAVVVCDPARLQALRWAVVVGVGFVASLAYVFLPELAAAAPVSGDAGGLAVFQTSGDPTVGLYGNVAGLYGFWRVAGGPVLPKQDVAGWLFLLAAIVAVAGSGAAHALRTPRSVDAGGSSGAGPERNRRFVASVVVVSALAGLLLALGGQGPTGPLFRWAYGHVPYFAVMREPEKFSALLALGYAACFGWGVEWICDRLPTVRPRWATTAVAAVAVVLALAYTPTIFDGLHGQIASSRLPKGWATVERVTAGRPGNLLVLPWHLYQSYTFTDNRVIANPAPSSFSGDIISSTNPQFAGAPALHRDPQSAYIERLLAESGGTGAFGALVAPLGVQYVALTSSADWRSYNWLDRQSDLRRIVDTPSIQLFKNTAFTDLGRRGGSAVQRLSPVAYRIPPGRPGWITVAVGYQPGWTLDGHPARATTEGLVSVWAGPSGGVLRFRPWSWALIGDAVSLVLLGGLAIALVVARVRRSRASPNPLTGE